MVKKLLFLLGAILLAAKAGGSNNTGQTTLAFPNGSGASRECDAQGCGHYGASRQGGRLHRGHDFLIIPGTTVRSPLFGKVSRHPRPYSADARYNGIEIVGTGIHAGYMVKMFYLAPGVAINATVKPGQSIGVAQDISAKYSSGMRPHIHLELYVDGVIVDPSLHFNLPR